METLEVFAFNLRRLRGFRKWTQADLCEASKVNIASIQSYENRRQWPGAPTIDALAKAFDVPVCEFFRDPNFDVFYFLDAFQKATHSMRRAAYQVLTLKHDASFSDSARPRRKVHK